MTIARYCPACGAPHEPDVAFCPACGADLRGTGTATTPPTDGLPVAASTSPPPAVPPPLVVTVSARPSRARIVLAILVLGAIIGGAVVASGVLVPMHAISGTFNFYGASGSCSGTGGYADIGPLTQVTLTNETGAILASTQLGSGGSDGTACLYSFNFGQVPNAKFYSVEVGKRGKITNSAAELQANGWTFGVTLGGP